MQTDHIDILLRLIIAHLLADFTFQWDKMAQDKAEKAARSKYLYIHILIVGVATYILLGQWTNWLGPLLIMVIHGCIDVTKVTLDSQFEWFKKRGKWLFIIDQVLHIVTLLMYWVITTQAIKDWTLFEQLLNQQIFANEVFLIVVIAYLIVTWPVGFLIGYITRPWQEEINQDEAKKIASNPHNTPSEYESLKDAGRTIGMIERALVLTFLLMQQYQAIGFLIAAKSVFRFGDLKESGQRKRTEYILIGTLISFIISILIGVCTHFLIESFKGM